MPAEVGGGHRQRGLAADPAPSTGARGEPACAAVARDLAIIASNAGALDVVGLRSKREVVPHEFLRWDPDAYKYKLQLFCM